MIEPNIRNPEIRYISVTRDRICKEVISQWGRELLKARQTFPEGSQALQDAEREFQEFEIIRKILALVDPDPALIPGTDGERTTVLY